MSTVPFWMRAELWLEPVLSAILPARCAICRRKGVGWLCRGCREALPEAPEPRCQRCDLPLSSAAACPDCAVLSPRFEAVRAVGPYEGSLRRAIIALKFERAWRLADPLADLLAARVRDCWGERAFDSIVPIPLDVSREQRRGYNQATLLSWRTSLRLGINHRPDWLSRRAPGGMQCHSDRLSRASNVAEAFVLTGEARGGALRGRRILLVDDVMTTGATLDAAAAVLASAGARVCGVVLARRTLDCLKTEGSTRERSWEGEKRIA